MSKILPHSGLGPGPDDLSQKGLKLSTYHDVTQRKVKIFFTVLTLAESFEGLNCSLARLAGKLWSC